MAEYKDTEFSEVIYYYRTKIMKETITHICLDLLFLQCITIHPSLLK
ncbi:MAG: hypothetical protein IPI04_02855 [Ignavibacteria bacterium]|nr:hypothetical protein [Ignavibacteria bacterium]